MVAHIRRPVCIPGQIRSLTYGSGINHRFGNKMSLRTQEQALSYPWTVSGMGLGQRTLSTRLPPFGPLAAGVELLDFLRAPSASGAAGIACL